ncbi:hypothetical protein AMS68_001679 [Peltaster fructicola]|uniref:Endonuclease/exonuclease/phosphatase domain-containing protein n=1 Tax=Peltaster fructicola TaxID=286661 RepID=A0A6H0XN27_9PEZI|nr:hypothetical protein AMS68_001679 [Peltaster fructicola]
MSISPPPAKRARIVQYPEEATSIDHELSIYSWNVNGIDPLLQTTIRDFWSVPQRAAMSEQAPAPPIRRFLHRHGWPTLCFLQEVKIRPGDDSKMRAVRRAVSNFGEPDLPDYEARFCLPNRARYPRASGGRVYGVCTLIRKDYLRDIVQEVREIAWDDEGRILLVESKATRSMPKLAVFNVYLVNGTELPYRDATSGEVTGAARKRVSSDHCWRHQYRPFDSRWPSQASNPSIPARAE